MGGKHTPGFLKIVDEAKQHISEVTIDQVQKMLDDNRDILLVDVRETQEWVAGHIPGAVHLGKGIVERDIERIEANHDRKLVLYCGGGYRSALAGCNLMNMGYTDVSSMAGGIRAWQRAGYSIVDD